MDDISDRILTQPLSYLNSKLGSSTAHRLPYFLVPFAAFDLRSAMRAKLPIGSTFAFAMLATRDFGGLALIAHRVTERFMERGILEIMAVPEIEKSPLQTISSCRAF